MKTRRFLSFLFILALTASMLCATAFAADSSQTFDFVLTSDAAETLKTGDVFTVTFTLKRTDKAEKWAMYAWQTEIAYDNSTFELVADSVKPAPGVGSSVHTGTAQNKIYFNDFSMSKSGDEYEAELVAGSFKLRVIGTPGSYTIQNTNYLVSTAGGAGSYAVTAKDLTVQTEDGVKASEIFTDVAAGSWYEDAVSFAVNHSLFNGMSATTFEPDTCMTRAMLVTVLWRLDGSPAVSGSNPYTDVESGTWYTDAVIWASANNIVNGYGNGLFGTNDNVTREQMAAILYRYASAKGCDVSKTNDLSGYDDAADISAYALTSMQWANAAGLITGRTETTLVPAGTATRAEVATILMRYYQNIVR